MGVTCLVGWAGWVSLGFVFARDLRPHGRLGFIDDGLLYYRCLLWELFLLLYGCLEVCLLFVRLDLWVCLVCVGWLVLWNCRLLFRYVWRGALFLRFYCEWCGVDPSSSDGDTCYALGVRVFGLIGLFAWVLVLMIGCAACICLLVVCWLW